MLDFYTRVLGFEVTDRGPVAPADGAPEIVFMSQVETDHHQIAFLSVRQDENPSNSVNHCAFRTESLQDVRDMLAALQNGGALDAGRVREGARLWPHRRVLRRQGQADPRALSALCV